MVSIIGFIFYVSNYGNTFSLKFFIKFYLYSSDLDFNKLVFNIILFCKIFAKFTSVFGPDNNPYKIQRPSISNKFIVLSKFDTPTQSNTP